MKLCTFSRVMKEKGIEDAINAVVTANAVLEFQAFSLDIYGQVWGEYKERFDDIQKAFPKYVRYCGSVDADESVDVLKAYFALLLPTYYEGEGFAGTLIDAYSAGVPVIATDWRYNSEFVTDNTEFVYPTGDQKALIDILTNVAVNPSLVLAKRNIALKKQINSELIRLFKY